MAKSLALLRAFSAYVPLAQSFLWVGLTGCVIWNLRQQIKEVASALASRLSRGDSLETPWFKLSLAPAAIRAGEHTGATAEGVGGIDTEDELEAALKAKEYPAGITEDLFLVHSSTTVSPKTSERRGLYRVRVWLEAYEKTRLDDVVRVSYRLYNDEFPKSVVATASRQASFELWLNAYGEFTVVGCVELRTQPTVWLTRYLDLPGRPPD